MFQMKMKEVESLTGVTREAIRFYIRKGLLPAPEKPKNNVAFYTSAHVERIRLIKKLQDEKLLPLDVILDVIDQGELDLDAQPGLPGLEFAINERLSLKSNGQRIGPENIKDLLSDTDLAAHDIDILIEDGVVKPIEQGGQLFFSMQDSAIVKNWAKIKRNGFSEALDYSAHDLKLYHGACQQLAKQEVRRFFTRTAGKVTTDEAARMSASTMHLIADMIGAMYSKEVITEITETNAALREFGTK
ncbi:MAG: DNA-binding transcriptional MerR regulator [Flavobacteriaceae bacterium]|jgi:DNA-binding transcriptional MerR regulator